MQCGGTCRKGKIPKGTAFEDLSDDWRCPVCGVSKKAFRPVSGPESVAVDLATNIESGRVFKKDTEVVWWCRNCGYLHTGKEAPKECPACAHPQAHFELLGENY